MNQRLHTKYDIWGLVTGLYTQREKGGGHSLLFKTFVSSIKEKKIYIKLKKNKYPTTLNLDLVLNFYSGFHFDLGLP